ALVKSVGCSPRFSASRLAAAHRSMNLVTSRRRRLSRDWRFLPPQERAADRRQERRHGDKVLDRPVSRSKMTWADCNSLPMWASEKWTRRAATHSQLCRSREYVTTWDRRRVDGGAVRPGTVRETQVPGHCNGGQARRTAGRNKKCHASARATRMVPA